MASAVRSVVAGDHDHLQAHLPQPGHGLHRIRLQRVGHRYDAGEAAVRGHEHGRLAVVGQAFRLLFQGARLDAPVAHELEVAQEETGAVDRHLDAVARGLR